MDVVRGGVGGRLGPHISRCGECGWLCGAPPPCLSAGAAPDRPYPQPCGHVVARGACNGPNSFYLRSSAPHYPHSVHRQADSETQRKRRDNKDTTANQDSPIPGYGFVGRSGGLKRSGTTATAHSALDFSDDPISPRPGWTRHLSVSTSGRGMAEKNNDRSLRATKYTDRQSHLTVATAGPGMAGRGAHHNRRISDGSLLSIYSDNDGFADPDAHVPPMRLADGEDMRNSGADHDHWATFASMSRTMPGTDAPPPPAGAPNLPPNKAAGKAGAGPKVVTPAAQGVPVFDAYAQPIVQRLPWARSTPPPVPAIPRQFTLPSRGVVGQVD